MFPLERINLVLMGLWLPSMKVDSYKRVRQTPSWSRLPVSLHDLSSCILSLWCHLPSFDTDKAVISRASQILVPCFWIPRTTELSKPLLQKLSSLGSRLEVGKLWTSFDLPAYMNKILLEHSHALALNNCF